METDSKKRILLAVDGEPHTDAAIKWAIDVAVARGLEIVAIHVKDPYLKQFSTEIYAQGREEYLDHVDSCLDENADETVDEFTKKANEAGVKQSTKVKKGNPRDVLLEEISSGEYSILITGRKTRKGPKALHAKDLPSLLLSAPIKLPILVVPSR